MSKHASGHPCATCTLRAAYDANPGSLKGRLWKWHTRLCPGWNAYLNSLDEEDRQAVIRKYA